MNQHPEWSYGAVLYEMNVRQLTPEGTLRAAAARLEFLRDLGVDAVWLMPIYPIGEAGRKGSLGSYYSIRGCPRRGSRSPSRSISGAACSP